MLLGPAHKCGRYGVLRLTFGAPTGDGLVRLFPGPRLGCREPLPHGLFESVSDRGFHFDPMRLDEVRGIALLHRDEDRPRTELRNPVVSRLQTLPDKNRVIKALKAPHDL